MKIGLYHGYNLTGSGSNEFTRYLAHTFVEQGHSVHIICREYAPQKLQSIGQLWQWDRLGNCTVSILDEAYQHTCILHQIPYGDFYPVYISGKRHSDTFKAFVDLTDTELQDFKTLNQQLLGKIFSRIKLDILHTNHLVMQPSLAIDPCISHSIPFIIYPHGSAIEYTVKKDSRYLLEARKAILACQGLIIGSNEVRDRIVNLFPDLQDTILEKTNIVGVGVDTRLFKPKPKTHCMQSITRLLSTEALQHPQGKSPELVDALHQQLLQNNYAAVSEKGDDYVHNDVDRNIHDKLRSVDFSKPVLLFVGALTVGKGLQSLICALPLIYHTNPSTQLIIIGAGSFREELEAFIFALAQRDQNLLTYLTQTRFDVQQQNQAELWKDVVYFLEHLSQPDDYFRSAKKLLQQVSFLGRFNHEQLTYVFPCAHLAVYPSVIPEAYPLVLMEALANGVLPMVSYFSGFKDAIDELERYLDKDLLAHMKIPMQVDTRVTTIAQNICSLLARLTKRDYSDDLARIARDNYDWSHRAKQLAEVYTQVILKFNRSSERSDET